MTNCQNIQQELSAYLDGELVPSLRVEIEAHLAACAHCQQELQDMKMLVKGVAALPHMEPAPRFLADVRRKIERGEKPAPMTWQDYVFRPYWLKVPLEVAALIVIVALVMRGGPQLLTRQFAQLDSAKVAPANALKSTVVAQAPAAPEARAYLSQSSEVLAKEEKSVGAVGTPLDIAGDKKQSVDGLTESAMVDDLGRRRELDQSKPGEMVTVHAHDFEGVRSLAQQLLARCNGRIVAIPSSKDATEQSFFVELPREYAAAFKLELLKTSGPAAKSAGRGAGERSGYTDAATPSTGVLTGSTTTNNSINAPGSLGLRDDSTVGTTVLEIHVVPPAN